MLRCSKSTLAATRTALSTGVLVMFTVGCSTSLHGSFIPSSYVDEANLASARELGKVEGRSCQTQPLYVLAMGEPATTDAAVEDAKAKIDGTIFITDLSIDDETEWKFLYSIQCIVVRATAQEAG